MHTLTFQIVYDILVLSVIYFLLFNLIFDYFIIFPHSNNILILFFNQLMNYLYFLVHFLDVCSFIIILRSFYVIFLWSPILVDVLNIMFKVNFINFYLLIVWRNRRSFCLIWTGLRVWVTREYVWFKFSLGRYKI